MIDLDLRPRVFSIRCLDGRKVSCNSLRDPCLLLMVTNHVLLFFSLHYSVGKNIKLLVDRPDDKYVFRLHRDRVYYVRADIAKLAGNISRDNLAGLGAPLGKFTKSGTFRLHITALDVLAPIAQHKVWLKPAAELSFLYGSDVLKSGVGRMSENIVQYQGVLVFSMADIPLGLATTAKSSADVKKMEPTGRVAFHQANLGEYLKSEGDLV